MSTPQVTFNVRYSSELIDEAARAFRDYRFRRYGLIFVVACLINAVGLAFIFWFGAKGHDFESIAFTISTAFVVLTVVAGPVWLLYQYFIEPGRRAAILKKALPSSRTVTLGPTTLWLTAGGREFAIPINVVVETSSLFLVVLSPFVFVLLPTSDLPGQAFEVLHGKSRSRVA